MNWSLFWISSCRNRARLNNFRSASKDQNKPAKLQNEVAMAIPNAKTTTFRLQVIKIVSITIHSRRSSRRDLVKCVQSRSRDGDSVPTIPSFSNPGSDRSDRHLDGILEIATKGSQDRQPDRPTSRSVNRAAGGDPSPDFEITYDRLLVAMASALQVY